MGYVVNKACVENKEKHFKGLQRAGHRGGFACYGPLTKLIRYFTACRPLSKAHHNFFD